MEVLIKIFQASRLSVPVNNLDLRDRLIYIYTYTYIFFTCLFTDLILRKITFFLSLYFHTYKLNVFFFKISHHPLYDDHRILTVKFKNSPKTQHNHLKVKKLSVVY